MIGNLFNTLLTTPILNLMVWFYQITGNLGVSIILLTLIIKLVLIPAMMPSIRSMKKQRELKPELDAIKKKYTDKKKQAEMQMELFRKHKINPAAGCSTQILMIMVLIALYNVIRKFSIEGNILDINTHLYFNSLRFIAGEIINTRFLYLDLTKADPFYIVAILSGALQFVASKMMLPAIKQGEKLAEKTPDKTDDMAFIMQQQTTYMLPIMNVVIGLTLPAGIMLYILTSTAFSIVQNYFVYGWGDLEPLINKLKFKK